MLPLRAVSNEAIAFTRDQLKDVAKTAVRESAVVTEVERWLDFLIALPLDQQQARKRKIAFAIREAVLTLSKESPCPA